MMSSMLKQIVQIALPVFLLLIAFFFSPYAALVSALIFTLFVPGYIIVEYYFKALNMQEKLLLYLLLSVMISTHLIYFLSLAIGYSQHTILIAFAFYSYFCYSFSYVILNRNSKGVFYICTLALRFRIVSEEWTSRRLYRIARNVRCRVFLFTLLLRSIRGAVRTQYKLCIWIWHVLHTTTYFW